MKSDLKDLLSVASTSGDVATLLLAGSAGLVANPIILHIGDLSPGTVGAASASLALGAKKAHEARRATRKAREQSKGDLDRARRAVGYLAEKGFVEGAGQLQMELDLCEHGLSDHVALKAAIEETLAAFRAQGVAQSLEWHSRATSAEMYN